MTKSTSPEVRQLIAMRDHHAAELKRCNDALALLGEAGKLARRAVQVTGRVQQRAANDAPIAPKRPTRQRKHKKGESPAAYYARHKATKAAGRRPVDQIRAAFASAGTKPLSVDAARAAVKQTDLSPAQVNRVTGIVLTRLATNREIKMTPDGDFVARKLATANANGAHA